MTRILVFIAGDGKGCHCTQHVQGLPVAAYNAFFANNK